MTSDDALYRKPLAIAIGAWFKVDLEAGGMKHVGHAG